MSRITRKLSQTWRASVAAISCAAVVVQPALAQMTPQGGTTVVQAPNGVPMVMIERPNSAGVSHNRYGQFDVGRSGVVLNNIAANYGLTGLAGYVPGNANLTGGAARLIINEVTQANASDLRGYIEVGGTRADVVIANPYGITCDGCGFINTDHAVLTTGTPTYAGDALQGFSVDGGMIQIGEGGADARGVSQFDLIARKVSFAGSVHGQRVRVIAGRNDVLFATGAATAKPSDGSASPDVAIDSTVFGGMYANKITIVSTESGVGVRAPEQMSAGASGMRITADGRLVMGRAQSQGGARVSAGSVRVRKQVVVQQELSLEAKREMILDADGVIVAAGAAKITSGTDMDLGAGSTLLSAGQMTLAAASALRQGAGARVLSYGDVAVSAGSATLAQGSLTYAGAQQPSGAAAPATLTYNVTGALQADATKMFATKGMILRAGTVTLGQTGGLPASQFVSGAQIDIAAGDATLTNAVIEARAALSVAADRALRSAGGGRFTAGGPLALSAAEMTLAGALIQSQDTATLRTSAGALETTSEVTAVDDVALNAAGELTNQGDVRSGADVGLSSGGDMTNGGLLRANGDVALTSGGALANTGGLQSGAAIVMSAAGALSTSGDGAATTGADAASMRLTGASVSSSGDLNIAGDIALTATTGALRTDGTLAGAGTMTLRGATLTTAGRLQSGGTLSATSSGNATLGGTLVSGGPVGVTSTGGDVILTGRLHTTNTTPALGAVALTADQNVTLAAGSVLETVAGAVTFTAGQHLQTLGTLVARGDASLIGDQITTGGIVRSTGHVRVSAAGALTQGADLQAAQASLSATGALTQTGTLKAGALNLEAARLVNSGQITSLGNVTLTGGDVLNSGTLAARGAIRAVLTGSLTNSGRIDADGQLQVRASGLDNQTGAAIEGFSASFTLTGAAHNAGTLLSGSDVALSAASLTNSGQIQAQSLLALTLGSLRNSGQMTSAQNFAAEISGTLDNTGGQLRAEQILQLGLSRLDIDQARWGAVDSPGLVRLQGLSGGRMAALRVGTGAVLSTTGALLIRADSVVNAGTIASASQNLVFDLGGDVTNTGLIYAGQDLVMRSNGTLTNDGGVLLAASNMVLCGNQTANCLSDLSGTRMTSLVNRNGGRIETLTGDLTIAADELRNERDVTVTLGTPVAAPQIRVDTGNRCVAYVTFFCSGRAYWYYLEDKTTKTDTVTVNGRPSEIVSGRNLTVSSGRMTNHYGTISSIGDMDLSAESITNEGLEAGTLTTITREYYKHISYVFSHPTYHLRSEGPIQSFTSTGVYFGTIQAGGALTGTVTGHLGNNAVGGHQSLAASGTAAPVLHAPATNAGTLAVTAVTASLAVPGAAGGATLTSIPGAGGFTTLPGGNTIGIGQVNLGAVQYGALFQTNPDPSSSYLIETRHKFIDQSAFISSDYFLGQLNHDADGHVKRLGDAMAETYLIRDQIQALTGRRILDPGMDERAQIKAMYDNAVDLSKSLGLRPGVALSPEQQAALTKDVVWLEERVVAGQKVLVPQVYLTGSRSVGLSAAQIAGNSVTLTVGSLGNSGSIDATDALSIRASGDVYNSGRLSAGGALGVTAGGTLLNRSGQIAGDTVRLAAAQIVSDLKTRTIGSGANTDRVALGRASIVAAKDLVLVSTGDIVLNGTTVTAGTGARITALGSVLLGEVETTHSRKLRIPGSSYTARARGSVTTSLNIGGDLNVEAGRDLVTVGADLNAGGAVTLDAKGNVSLGAARRVGYSDQFSKSGGWFASRVERSERLDVTHEVSTVQAGGTLTVRAGGDLVDQSSQLTAGSGQSVLQAGGDISVASLTDIHASTSYKRTAYLGGLLDFSSERKSLSTIGLQAQASFAGDLDIVAGKDLTLQGAQINAEGRLRTDVGGDTTLSAAVDTSFTSLKAHHNNSLIVTDTTDVRNSQTAKFVGLQGGSVELDPDSKTTIGLVGEQAAVGARAPSLIGVSKIEDPTQKMALTRYFIPEGTAPPAGGLAAALQAPSRTAGAGTGSGKPNAAFDFASSTTKIGLPSASDGAQFAFYDDLKLRPTTTVAEMEIIQHHFHDQKTQLGVVGKLVLAYFTGQITGALQLTGAANAMASAGISGVVEGAITGDFNLENILKNVAFAGISAQFGTAFNWGEKLNLPTESLLPFGGDKFSVAGIVNQVGQSTLSAGLQSALYGQDFGEAFKRNLASNIINLGIADAQNGIGTLAKQAQFKEGSAQHVALHALAGCVGSELLGGKCGAGAAAAAASALYAGFVEGNKGADYAALTPAEKQAKRDQWQRNADLITGIAGALASNGDAAVAAAAAQVGSSAFTNNYLTHEESDELDRLLKDCLAGNAEACQRKDALGIISDERDKLLELCKGVESVGCTQVRAHLALTVADWLAKARAGASDNISEIAILRRQHAIVQLQKYGQSVQIGRIEETNALVAGILKAAGHDSNSLDTSVFTNRQLSEDAILFLSGDRTAIEDRLKMATALGAAYGSALVGRSGAARGARGQGGRPATNKGLCSFHADTLVLTDGGLLPISDVNTNMSVWSRNPANGEMAWQSVQAQYSNPYEETVSVTMRDVETGVEQTIVSNRIHPYFVQTARAAVKSSEGHVYAGPLENGHWVDAAELQAGDRLLNDDGTWTEVVSVAIEAEPLTAFNLTVAEFHTYFVAANENAAPVWVHNNCATDFESSIVRLPPGERVAVVRTRLADVARSNGWSKDTRLSRLNGRDVYRDPQTGNYYAVDSQHGRFEVTNRRGNHMGEVDIDGVPTKAPDPSGGHDLRTR